MQAIGERGILAYDAASIEHPTLFFAPLTAPRLFGLSAAQ
jgi:hypothetical protein